MSVAPRATVVLSSVVLVLALPAAARSQLPYDVTRTFAECTRGPTSSCAQLTIRTASLSSGGSEVAIGLSNLQGTSPFDNTGGTLLTSAGFTMKASAGSGTTTASLFGVPASGASGNATMNLTATGEGISLAAPFSHTVTNETAKLSNTFALCTSYVDIYCTGYDLWTDITDAPYTNAVTNEYGISGSISRFAPLERWTYTGATYWQAIISREPDYDYSCGGFFIPKTCHLPVYGLGEISNVFSNVHNTDLYNFFPMASTYSYGSSIWFDFISPNRYDAEDIASAWFDSDSESSPETTYACEPQHSPTGCLVLSDVLTNNMPAAPPVTGAPEPGSLILVATGVGAVAIRRRRRRDG